MQILVSFDRVDQQLSNDIKLMHLTLHWKVNQKFTNFPKIGTRIDIYPSLKALNKWIKWPLSVPRNVPPKWWIAPWRRSIVERRMEKNDEMIFTYCCVFRKTTNWIKFYELGIFQTIFIYYFKISFNY